MTNRMKGEIYDRTDHKAPDVEQKYSSALSLTLALHGSGWLTPRLRRFTSPPPRRETVPVVQENVWAP